MSEPVSLPASDAVVTAIVAAIRSGDVTFVERQLAGNPAMASARIVDELGVSRTLLHVVADWPGHVPNSVQLVAALRAAGADLNAPLTHLAAHGAPETSLHWAASSDDVVLLDALLDVGADIEARGAVLTGGTAMSCAVVFAQWRAARRLLERGASTTLWESAALGVVDRVRALLDASPTPNPAQLTNALWHASRAGQYATAALLFARGADARQIVHDGKSAMDVAQESGVHALVELLCSHTPANTAFRS